MLITYLFIYYFPPLQINTTVHRPMYCSLCVCVNDFEKAFGLEKPQGDSSTWSTGINDLPFIFVSFYLSRRRKQVKVSKI